MAEKRARLPGSRDAWSNASRAVLVPLMKALLDQGLRYRDIVRIACEALVEAALPAGELTDAKLVEATGMPRRIAKSLRSRAASHIEPELSYAAATRIVSRWTNEADFTKAGKPRVLPLHGSRSFATLASMVGVDPARALHALKKAGMVRVSRAGVVLRNAAYIPSEGEIEMLDILGRDGAEFLRTMIHNVEASPSGAIFQRKASYDNIGTGALRNLRPALREEAMRALLAADRVLAANDRDRNHSAPRGKRTRVSFGIYLAEEAVDVQGKLPSKSGGRGRR